MVGHCRDTLRLGTAGILCGWGLRGYSAVGHCWDTLWLDYGWALPGYSMVGQGHSSIGHCLLGYSAVRHCRDTVQLGTAIRLRAGEDNIDFQI